MSESNADKARRGFDAALRGDLEAISEMLDPDVKWHGGDPDAPGACRNRQDALAVMRQSDLIRGGRFELVEVVEVDDKVVVVIRVQGRPGEPAPAPVANVTTFRDGKVVEIVHYPTANDALAAAGAD